MVEEPAWLTLDFDVVYDVSPGKDAFLLFNCADIASSGVLAGRRSAISVFTGTMLATLLHIRWDVPTLEDELLGGAACGRVDLDGDEVSYHEENEEANQNAKLERAR
jgi:hypothetical protein